MVQPDCGTPFAFLAGDKRDPTPNDEAKQNVDIENQTIDWHWYSESIPKLVETGATPSSGDGM